MKKMLREQKDKANRLAETRNRKKMKRKKIRGKNMKLNVLGGQK